MRRALEPLAILRLELEGRVLDVEVPTKASLQSVEHRARIRAAMHDDVGGEDIHAARDGPHMQIVNVDHAAARDLKFRCVWVDRGTGRSLLADYRPDAIVPTLDSVLLLFRDCGWMRSPHADVPQRCAA